MQQKGTIIFIRIYVAKEHEKGILKHSLQRLCIFSYTYNNIKDILYTFIDLRHRNGILGQITRYLHAERYSVAIYYVETGR